MWKKVVVLTLSSCTFITGTIYILKKYFGGKYCYCKERLDGKVIIITGATSGIGRETATVLASKGANLVLACRDISKGEEVTSYIKEKTGNPSICCERLDLSSFQSIVAFVNRFKRKGKACDIDEVFCVARPPLTLSWIRCIAACFSEDKLYGLLNNAGLFHVPFQLTGDGFDLTLQTNFLGPFLLSYLLLDVLKKGAPSRIVNVGSESHWYPTHLDISKLTKNFSDQKDFDKFVFYGTTKLCLMLMTSKLSKLLSGSGVTVNSVNPGNVRTNIHRHFPAIRDLPLLNSSRFLLWLTFKTPHQGAQTSVHLLTDPALSGVSGKYFSDLADKEVSSLAKSVVLENELWEATLLWLQPFLNQNDNRDVGL